MIDDDVTPAASPADDNEEFSPPALPSDLLDDDALSSSESDEEQPYVVHTPSDAELSEASPDVRGLIPMIGTTREQLREIYELRLAQIGPEKFLAQAAVSGSYENILWFSLSNYSAEVERAADAISAIEDKDNFSYRLEKDGKSVLGPTNFRPQKSTEIKMVSGESGMVDMLSTQKGKIRRVPLYNSGFCLDLRSPNSDDLSRMLRSCRADLEEYGRDFGSHFYAYADLLLKRAVFNTILSTTIGSSLKDWKKPGVLAQRLKLTDYDVILTHLAALMYPDGYPDFRHSCHRPIDAAHPVGCDHVETVTADLTQLIHTNFPRLNEAAIAHMVKSRLSAEPIKVAALEAYHKELDLDGQVIRHGDFEFTMTVPSMADYFSVGEAFYADLINEISANNRKEIYDAIAFRESRHYVPWIKRVTNVQGEQAGIVSEDKPVIAFVLDTIATEDPDRTLITKFITYINQAKLSHICYKSFPCAACGHEPVTPSGFVLVEPQHSFFILSTQKLTRSLSSLKTR